MRVWLRKQNWKGIQRWRMNTTKERRNPQRKTYTDEEETEVEINKQISLEKEERIRKNSLL
jgi:hypothetical protein